MQILTILTKLISMDFILDAVTGLYRQSFPFGYLRTGKASARKSGSSLVISFTPESTHKVLQAKALDELTEKVTELTELIDSFHFPEGNDPRLFRTATVSDSGDVRVEAQAGADIQTYELDIDAIARAKTFKSIVLSANAETDLAEGTHSFEIEKNGTVQSVDISVSRSGSDPDTNRDVLAKIARAVNEADSDLEAEVVDVERKVYSGLSDNLFEEATYLKVRTRETGDSVDFILQDSSGTIINDLKLDRSIQAGGKAVYTLNDTAYESQTNSVTADGGKLKIELLDETDRTVTIKVENGADPAKEQIAEIVSAHNDYINFLDNSRSYIDNSVKNSMLRAVREIKTDLEQVGFALDQSGTIQIEDQFEKAFEENTDALRQTLTGSDGLFPVMSKELDEVSEGDTGDYAADIRSVIFSLYL